MGLNWTNEKLISQIRDNYKKFQSLRKTAHVLGINLKTVSRYTKDLIPPEKQQRGKIRYSKSVRKHAQELYKKIGSIHKVARIMRIDPSTIHSWVGNLVQEYSTYGKFRYDKSKARALYKKMKSITKVAEVFGVAPATVGIWAKDLIPVAKTKEERIIEKVFIKNNIPYSKIRLQGYSHTCVPDFVIPPEDPKIIVEVKTNGRKNYQQWHRLCNLLSKQMAFCSIDLKKKYPNLVSLLVINKRWNASSMKILNMNFDKVFTLSQTKKIIEYIKEKYNN